MRQPGHTNAKLSRQVLDELGIDDISKNRPSTRQRPGLRKEQRKAARVQKKSKKSSRVDDGVKHPVKLNSDEEATRVLLRQKPEKIDVQLQRPLKSILKLSKAQGALSAVSARSKLPSQPPSTATRPSKTVRDRLAADDAEIAALEKALGIKDTRKLPTSFKEEGLGELLEGLDDESVTEELHHGKRNRVEEDDRLRSKRLKVQSLKSAKSDELAESIDEASISLNGLSDQDSEHGSEPIPDRSSDNAESDEEASVASTPPVPSVKRHRENPYIAPVESLDRNDGEKYIPPSLRGRRESDSEDHSHLRRRMQGLLNRLSEANLLALIRDFEDLYRKHPRQDVSMTIIDLLLELLVDPSNLQDTFVILHAGFIAALYKIVGQDFGAMVISRINDDFDKLYRVAEEASSNKRMKNLISLLAQLYNFKVIGSNLIYDLIKFFIQDLSDSNTELLLKITQSTGPQLRKDDPGSLKAINQLLQSAVASKDPSTLSIRTSFMVETISNLASKGAKNAISESVVVAEHIVQMRRILGSLNDHNVKSSEPLGITLKDLKELDKRGKWWLVGASFRDEEKTTVNESSKQRRNNHGKELGRDAVSGSDADLSRIARHLGMNTDVRRSILVTILSADDYEAAHKQLRRLPLNSSQRTEIPRVLIRCSSAQDEYNPFFTLLARRLISAEPKLSKAFQYSLWNLFDLIRESRDDGKQVQEDGPEGQLELRSIVNIARMYGTLVAQDGLSFRILKDLNFAYLAGKIRTFVEILISTTILQSQEETDGSRNEKRIMDIFLKCKEIPDMARGLQYFLKEVVSKTDIVGSKQKLETVKWGCQVARHALDAIASVQ